MSSTSVGSDWSETTARRDTIVTLGRAGAQHGGRASSSCVSSNELASTSPVTANWPRWSCRRRQQRRMWGCSIRRLRCRRTCWVEREVWQCRDGLLSTTSGGRASTGSRRRLERHWARIGGGGGFGRCAVGVPHGKCEVRVRDELDGASGGGGATLVERRARGSRWRCLGNVLSWQSDLSHGEAGQCRRN